MFQDLRNTKLFKELDVRAARKKKTSATRYRGQIESSFHEMEDFLKEIRRYFHHFTDHCISHSIRIIKNIGTLLEKKQVCNLTDEEIYLLIAVSLIHDIGMVVSEADARELCNDSVFLEERKRILSTQGFDDPLDWRLHGVERLIVAEYVRMKHGKRAKLYFDRNINPCRQLTGGNAELSKWLGKLAEGHTLPFDKVADPYEYPTDIRIGDDHANMQFIVICLRIGDLLDITTKRASPVMRELSEPLSTLSKAHWDQYRDIEIRDLGPGKTIVIGGRCPSQDAERHLREWVSWLEDECEKAVTTLNTGPDNYRLKIGRIQYSVQAQTDEKNRPLYEFRQYRFNLDEEEVFKRLFGKRLYGRTEAALRELIQNAVDATRVRAAYECRGADSWHGISASEKQSLFEQFLAEHSERLGIKVRLDVALNQQTGAEERWLFFTDQGIGMSRSVIERYLLKIGRSRWREDPIVKDLQIGTIGEFGIGFISILMLGDQITIETKSCLPHDEGIWATIFSWRGYLATQTATDLPIGTTIGIRLRKDVRLEFQELLEMIKLWAPFVELPITVSQGDRSAVLNVTREGRLLLGEKCSVFRLFNSKSLAVLGPYRGITTAKRPSSLCQDGLIVPDAPHPRIYSPEQAMLYWRGLSSTFAVFWGFPEVGLLAEMVGIGQVPHLAQGGYHAHYNRPYPQAVVPETTPQPVPCISTPTGSKSSCVSAADRSSSRPTAQTGPCCL